MIAIIDYGMGNLHSVSKAVERLGMDVVVTADRQTILNATGAILPGVGAFGDAMQFLHETGLKQVVQDVAIQGKPLLGICLGMQLLFTESEEFGTHQGLGLLPGRVVRFTGDYKIPHMGWNRLNVHKTDPIVDGANHGYVYFVHSFHVQVERESDLLASTDYHQRVAAVVGNRNVYGMQFHPEKSGETGMRMLQHFLQLTRAPYMEK